MKQKVLQRILTVDYNQQTNSITIYRVKTCYQQVCSKKTALKCVTKKLKAKTSLKICYQNVGSKKTALKRVTKKLLAKKALKHVTKNLVAKNSPKTCYQKLSSTN